MPITVIDGDWILYNPGVCKYIGQRHVDNNTEYIIVNSPGQAVTFPDNIIARQVLDDLIQHKPMWRNFCLARVWIHLNY
jgi:hypothetical protein